ncbi:Uncharacterised protein [Salmonella bongori]|nr:Uncharacterised protein [Salmonella bongori]
MMTLVYSVSAGSGSALLSNCAAPRRPPSGFLISCAQTAHQIAGGDLLRVLQLLLTQTTLVIHRRHFEQDQNRRADVGRSKKEYASDYQFTSVHFVIGKALFLPLNFRAFRSMFNEK